MKWLAAMLGDELDHLLSKPAFQDGHSLGAHQLTSASMGHH
jgi:hypothetical protein